MNNPKIQDEKVLSNDAPGDERTPDKKIGQVKYAELKPRESKKAVAGDPKISKLEPEKQGGIGGP